MAPNYYVHEMITPAYDNYYQQQPAPAAATGRSWFKKGCWVVIAIFGVVQVIMTVELVRGLLSPSDYDLGSLDFALYKNSRFQECYNQPSQSVDCSNFLVNADTIDSASTRVLNPQNNEHVDVEWCAAVSCLKDYKIIPSTPKPAAYSFTGFQVWFWLNIAIIMGIYALMKFTTEEVHELGHPACHGVKWFDWLFFALDIAIVGFWWYGIFLLMSNAARYPVVSLFNWFTAWRYTRAIQYHPLACKLKGHAPAFRTTIMTFLLVYFLLQMLVTFAIAGVKAGDIDFGFRSTNKSKYDCAEAWFGQAPGTSNAGNSTCDLKNICHDSAYKWMFANRGFYFEAGIESHLNDMGMFMTSNFILLSIICFILACWMFCVERRNPGAKMARICGPVDGSMCVVLGILTFVGIINAGYLVNSMARSGKQPNREASVMFDQDCRVAHVILSSWQNYLDIKTDQIVRVVRWWVNA